MKPQRLVNGFKWLNIVFLGFAAICSSLYWSFQYPNYRDGRKYLENNVQRIVENQEQKLHIKHAGMPKVSYTLFFPSILDFRPQALTYDAEYDWKTNTLYFNPLRIRTPQETLTNKVARTMMGIDEDVNIDCVVEHEFGHVYADFTSERLRTENIWPGNIKRFTDNIAYNIASEGMAENSVVSCDNDERHKGFGKLPNLNPSLFDDRPNPYSIGYHLVQPLVKEFGLQRIVEYIVQHPLQREDLANLTAYQAQAKRVLNGLIQSR